MKAFYQFLSLLVLFTVVNVAAIGGFDVPVVVVNSSGKYAPLVTFNAPSCSNIPTFDIYPGKTKRFTAKDCGTFLSHTVTISIENDQTKNSIIDKCRAYRNKNPGTQCFYVSGFSGVISGDSDGNPIKFTLTDSDCRYQGDNLYYCNINVGN